MEQNVVLEMHDISKNFTGVRALSHVDFTLRKGEIHALMGENGAGKSTLIKVLTGVHEFESGTIHMAGNSNAIINHSPQEAQANGISTVYQEVNLCPNLTVAENLFIGREPRKMGMIDWKQMNERSGKLLESLDIHVPPTQMLEECSIAIQQMIAIARAVDMKCQVLILDEPTSSLDDDEVEKLFVLMRRLRDEGVGIIFVTHFLEQVYAVCDRITVLRNGELVGEYETKDLPRVMLVAKMMGKDFDDLADIKGDHKDKRITDAEPVIEAKGLSHKGTIKPFDITINKGEVIGLTGLLGSGRSELVRAIYGADKADTGTLKVKGKEVKINTPLDAMKLGMAYLPEDRKAEGIIADLSVRENIIIALQAKRGMFHPLSKKEMEDAADKYIKLLQIKTASRETPIKSLSGGNQQKVILGRWLLTDPEVLLLDEPLGALDLQLRRAMQIELKHLQKKLGITFIYITHDQEEAINMSDRIAVMKDGRIEQIGTPDEIYNHPKTSYVATFVGNANILHGVAESIQGENAIVKIGNDRVIVKLETSQQDTGDTRAKQYLAAGEKVTLAVRSENILLQETAVIGDTGTDHRDTVDISVSGGGLDAHNKNSVSGLQATVTEKNFAGGQLRVTLKLSDGTQLIASRYGIDASVAEGQTVRCSFLPADAVLVDREDIHEEA